MELFNCYAYGRLSREDGDGGESDSIKNQRDLLRAFIEARAELRLAMEGYDDGYTGTNFDRPHFKEMLEAIRAGTINCVVVKDLSRFGREYIQGGRYTEKLFPALGVRFIAVNDGYDSARADAAGSLLLPFKNLINDAYCRDTSVKIRSHLDVKRRNGEFIGSFAPYGYRKDPDDKNRLLADEPAAEVVRDIFARRIGGQSCQGIADELNALGVPSPMEYKRAQGLPFESGYRVRERALWSAVAVRRILQNAVYLGVMEQGKRTTPNYKVKSVIARPPSEWMRVEGTHEPIVGREDFELAARLMLADTRRAPGARAVYPLAGLLRCGGCGGAMVRRTSRYDGREYHYYVCAAHRENAGVCAPHSVSEEKLEAAVLAGINLHIRAAALQKIPEGAVPAAAGRLRAQEVERQLSALQSELAKKREIRNSLSRRFAAGEVPTGDFEELDRMLADDCRRAERAAAARERELAEIAARGGPDSPQAAYFRRRGLLQTLDRAAAARLVERVRVYGGGRVEVVLRYREEFERAAPPAEKRREAGAPGEAV